MPRKRRPKIHFKIAAIDAETDPFLYEREPEAFVWEFWNGEIHKIFWGTNCTQELYDFLIYDLKDPHIIYAHNGGKFDFFFFLRLAMIENPMMVINGRVVKAKLGIHEIRDSYSILPLPLEKLAPKSKTKIKFDYEKMERKNREKHRTEILEYLHRDCTILLDRVNDFRERFGDQLTIGSTAIKELEKFHPHMVPHRGRYHDGTCGEYDRRVGGNYVKGSDCWIDLNSGFRRFYYGGRVENFESGEVHASPGKKLKFYDITSSYPKSMRDYDHPTSGNYFVMFGEEAKKNYDPATGKLHNFDGPFFMRFIGKNNGALPSRDEDGSLTFNKPFGEFFACSHELQVAAKYGLIEVNQIVEILCPHFWGRFDLFVNYWFAEKARCKAEGDFVGELFAKLILNSSYGKFATSPFKFREWFLVDLEDPQSIMDFEEWKAGATDPEKEQDSGTLELWKSKIDPRDRQFFDVAIAASITSASRAMLLEAKVCSTRPVYCDTDSLLCEELKGVLIDDTELGAWKFEGSCDVIYIGGKKLYAAELDEIGSDGKHKIKIASKGARLTFEEMRRVALGENVMWKCDAPNFRLSGETKFVRREIKKRVRVA